jgi:S-(hydroxymethyl)glutathione dehydrogenase/alcohol dehydrogenase
LLDDGTRVPVRSFGVKAAVVREVGAPLTIEDVGIDDPHAREVLIRTSAAGVCHSDLHFTNGTYVHPLPFVPGHEAAGIVELVGSDVHRVKAGDHVITCLNAFCGHCEYCLTGHLSLCTSTETLRSPSERSRLTEPSGAINQFARLSAFAEYMLVHEHSCVPIREDMPLDRAALIGCAAVTGVGAVIHTAAVKPGENVAVIGCGGVGLAAINGAAIAGAGRIIAVDRISAKLDLARQFGATDTIDASLEDPVAQVLEMTRGGVHHSFEAIGLKATCEQSFRMLARGGTANVIGMVPPGVNLEIHARDLLGERRIQGSLMGSNRFPIDMPRYVDFYMRGKLKLDGLISQRIRLDAVNKALAEFERGELARSVIIFDD